MVKSSNNQKSTTFGINNKVLKGMHYVMLLIMLHITFVAPAQGIVLAYKQGFAIQSHGNSYLRQDDFNRKISNHLPIILWNILSYFKLENMILHIKDQKANSTLQF